MSPKKDPIFWKSEQKLGATQQTLHRELKRKDPKIC